MVTDSELVGRLREIVRHSDLQTTTASAVRRRLEEEFAVDLYGRRAFITQQIDIFLQNGSSQYDDQETEVDEDVKNSVVNEGKECENQNAGGREREISGEEEEQEEGSDHDIGQRKKRHFRSIKGQGKASQIQGNFSSLLTALLFQHCCQYKENVSIPGKTSQMTDKKIWLNLEPRLSEQKFFGCKLSLHSRYEKVSKTILDCLNEKDMEFIVEKTQFVNLIKFAKDYNLSSQIIWFMVMKQVYVTNDDEMWFIVNDRPIRFSRMEYALISGLHFSDNFPEELTEVSEFCDRHFQDSNKVSVKEVEARLKDMKSTDELLNIERVKLALLYFVSGVLWPIAPLKNPQVHKTVLSLTHDFDTFNKYFWGTMAFKGALCDLRCKLVEKEAKLSGKGKPNKSSDYGSCDMKGFIHPLQILAYECVRGIGEQFAKQREGDNTHLPRMCNWISIKWHKKGSPRYFEVLEESKSCKKIVRSFLSPTKQESVKSYIRNIAFKDSCTDSHLSHINSLLLEGYSVYCTNNSTLRQSRENPQSTDEVQQSEFFPRYKSKRSRKIRSTKEILEKQTHQAQPKDVYEKATTSKMSIVDDKSDANEQVRALRKHVDKKSVKFENMLSDLDNKLESIMKFLNISTSTKLRWNDEPVCARSKKKKTHRYDPETTFVTQGDQGVTREQEVVIEPFISSLTCPNEPEATLYTQDGSEGVTREQEVVFEAFTCPPIHPDEPEATSRTQDGNEGVTREQEVVFESFTSPTHPDEPEATLHTQDGNEGVTREQEVVFEAFTSPPTHPDEPEATLVTQDGNEGVIHEQEVVFEAFTSTLSHPGELPLKTVQRYDKQTVVYTRSKKKNANIDDPKTTFITQGGDEKAPHVGPVSEQNVNVETDMIIGGDEVAVTATEMSMPQDTSPALEVGDEVAVTVIKMSLSQDTTPALAVDKHVRTSKKSQFCRSPYVQPLETPALTALGYTGPYNGSFEPVQCVSIKKVLPKFTKEIGELHDLLKVGLYGSYSRRWFTDFLTPRHWLDTSHIQESMHGLSMLQKTYPHLVKQDAAIMDAYFSQDIGFAYHNARDDFKNSKWKKLFAYVDGRYRHWTSIPWTDASSILMPLNLSIHWVALVVNVKDGTITIYDCNLGCYTDDEMKVHIQPIEYVVQHLLQYCKVKTPDIWKTTRPKEFTQNKTSSDCGAWTIKTLEVELSQQTPYALDDDIVNSYRKYLATSVWYGEWIL